MGKDKVAIIASHDCSQIHNDIEKGIRAVGGLDVKPGCHVVIKPNLCCPRGSDTGSTTDIRFIESIINYINSFLDNNCTISIVESDAQGIDADYAFEHFGLNELVKNYPNVKLVNLTKDVEARVSLKDGKAFDIIEIPEVLLESSYFISLSKLKTHVDQRLSCSLKNQFGCITKKYKSIFHPFLSEAIYDVNNLYNPDLSIIDGIIGMEGFGPTDGTPKRMNCIIFGTNPAATDIVAAKLMCIKPRSVPHLKFYMKTNNYSENDFELIDNNVMKNKTHFEFTGTVPYYMARFGLRIQRWSQYVSWGGEFLQKVRSALALVGFKTIQAKVSYKDMFRIARAMMFRFSR